jgi:hypothetical protein
MPRPTLQFALNIVVPISRERLPSLDGVLQQINRQTIDSMQGRAVPGQLLPFARMPRIHFARFAILDGSTERPSQVGLAMSTHFDGPEGQRCTEAEARRGHVDELVAHGRAGLDAVFANADGYPGERATAEQVRDYLLSPSHVHDATAFYCGSRGRSCRQILDEARLRRRAVEWLDERRKLGPLPSDLHVLREAMAATLGPVSDFPAQHEDWVALGVGALALVAALPLLLPLVAVAAPVLYLKEQADVPFEPVFDAAERAHVRSTAVDENLFFLNALTNVVDVKPGALRLAVLRAVMFAIDFLAKRFYVRGKLGEIPSIHFANWFLVDGGKRLAFVSNFDSSWESYLGDFIDQASSGLTGVWSNTVGYPRTTLLLWAGARSGERFKAWARHIQVVTQVWYAAYPGLSIVDINDNTLIRRGLASASVPPAKWLSRLR